MKLNLSEWALNHRSFIWFLMIIVAVAGTLSFVDLGREEDPSFTIKVMVIRAYWPGATVEDTIEQVTERIERAAHDIDGFDFTRSETTPGKSTTWVWLKDAVRGQDITDAWYQVRKKVGDISREFPEGIVGPFFNDEFGTVFGNIYAFTSDGISYRKLRDAVEEARSEILSLKDVGKVELIGAQDEVVSIAFSTQRLANYGISAESVMAQLQAQNAVTPAGTIQAGSERVDVRVSGQFSSEKDLLGVNLVQGDTFFRLADVATISRGYKEPPDPLFRFEGRQALGLGVSMAANGNILELGEALKDKMAEVERRLPIGIGVHLVSDQSQVVDEAVGGFTKALGEAVAIVLIVSFVSLGLRAGFVVAIAIPFVLALVFVFMEFMGISLQRVSLGALIISLGLLVDDAMITIEMMVKRLEFGDTLAKAATFAYTSTAFPMLTGTLVTIVGFVPIVLTTSTAGEYVGSLFWVIFISLVLSWVVAVLFSPLLGVKLLPRTVRNKHAGKPGRLMSAFSAALKTALHFRWLTVGATLALFVAAVASTSLLQNQFFPVSERPEVLVDLTMPHGATIRETEKRLDEIETYLAGDPDIERWSSYVGQGAVRFYLPLDQHLDNPYFGQIVIVAASAEARQCLKEKLEAVFADKYFDTNILVHYLELGPPIGGRPVQYRVSGPDIQTLRTLALDLGRTVSDNPHVTSVDFDWNTPQKSIRIDIQQDKARRLGINSANVSQLLYTVINGTTITRIKDSIYLIDVIARGEDEQRNRLETLENLQVRTTAGTNVPLSAVADIAYGLEQPLIGRRDRVPTITMRATVDETVQPATVADQLAPAIAAFAEALPDGYAIAEGGEAETSSKSRSALVDTLPVMGLLILFILMVQLQSMTNLAIVLSTAPLGLIGVVAALLATNTPLGYVALLGVLALTGILIRNSVILIGQIDDNLAAGLQPWDAVVDATQHRLRPILLTAAAASLGMVPIASEVFWQPMAFAMIGGIVFATILTLFFLPALYVLVHRIVPRETKADGQDNEAVSAPQAVEP